MTDDQAKRRELVAAILNEGVIPRREQLVGNLIEEVAKKAYKRGFKECEAYFATERERVEIEARIALLHEVQTKALSDTSRTVSEALFKAFNEVTTAELQRGKEES